MAPTTASTELPGDETVSGNKSVFVRLTVMMFLELAVFGSWFATLGLVLKTYHLATIIGTAFSLAALAAIISPMFLGALGDRFLSSQKALGIAHLAGGAVMLFLPSAVNAVSGGLTLVLIFVYMLFFQPTLGLANSIAFRHLGGARRLFPYIRVFGTIGWVVAGVLVGALGLSASVGVFTVTAIVSIVTGLYSFTLPATPPPAKGVRFSIGDVVGADAFQLLRRRNFAVLMACALLTSIALGVYNTFASTFVGALGIHNVAGVLAIGQASEVVFIVTIPFVVSRFGTKWGLLIGMLMWGVRFGLFIAATGGHTWPAVVAIALQAVCWDFFLILAAMYVSAVVPVEASAQAQSMLIVVISGFGALVGSFVAGQIFNATVAVHPGDLAAWTPIWLVPIGTAILTGLLWTSLFRYSRNERLVPFES